MGLKNISLSRPAALAMAVAGAVYAGLSLVPLLKPAPLIPVANKNLAAGTYLQRSDIVWVSANNSRPVVVQKYLAVGVRKGQVLSAAMLTARPSTHRGFLVSIAGNVPPVQVGQEVEIFIISQSGHLWQLGPVMVFKAASGASLTGTAGSPLIVEMNAKQAAEYEEASLHGTVSVVGLQP
ncbi:MAG: SAF domain-containing protein [Sulfobacillus thermotolerans]|uniref:SAF domain-containing protein n=1 Tax=Sulfobacillus thermotolerans TaxID=338644 RepID=A0ABM6RRV5_9FIRM|nr:hypothetical protein BXT84_08830 [Sulfobacillus thermotolerans]MCY0907960.1 SAF domain-containing protein [Sulfobacillus thermotolerans]